MCTPVFLPFDTDSDRNSPMRPIRITLLKTIYTPPGQLCKTLRETVKQDGNEWPILILVMAQEKPNICTGTSSKLPNNHILKILEEISKPRYPQIQSKDLSYLPVVVNGIIIGTLTHATTRPLPETHYPPLKKRRSSSPEPAAYVSVIETLAPDDGISNPEPDILAYTSGPPKSYPNHPLTPQISAIHCLQISQSPILQYVDQFQSKFANLVSIAYVSPTDLQIGLIKALLRTSDTRLKYAEARVKRFTSYNPRINSSDLRRPGIDPTLPINLRLLERASRDIKENAPTVTRNKRTTTGLYFPNRGYPLLTLHPHPKTLDRRRACLILLQALQPHAVEAGFHLPKRKFFESPQSLCDYATKNFGKLNVSNKWWEDTKQLLARHKLNVLTRQVVTWHHEAAIIYWVIFYHWLHIFAPLETVAWKTLFPDLTPNPDPAVYPFLEPQHPAYARFFTANSLQTPADQFRNEEIEKMYLGYNLLSESEQGEFKKQHEKRILEKLRHTVNRSAEQEIERTLYLIERERVQTPNHCPLADVLAEFLSDYRQAFFRKVTDHALDD